MSWSNNPRTFEQTTEDLLRFVEGIDSNTRIELNTTYIDRPEFEDYTDEDGYPVHFDADDIKIKNEEVLIKKSDWETISAGTEAGRALFEEKYAGSSTTNWFDTALYWGDEGIVSATGICSYDVDGTCHWERICNVQYVDANSGEAWFWLDSRLLFCVGVGIIDDEEWDWDEDEFDEVDDFEEELDEGNHE